MTLLMSISVVEITYTLRRNEIIDKTLGTMEEQLKMTILEKKEMAKSLTDAEYRLSELTKQVSDDKVAHEEFREAENSINALNVQLAERNKAGEDLSLELQHAKVKASKERVLLNSKISSLEVDLLRSENEVERLGFAMNALTNSHANAVTRLEDIKHGLVNQKHLLNQTTEMEQRMKIMVSEVEKANAQLDDAKKVACEESDRLNGNIAILESDLIESRSDLEAVEKSLNDTTTKMSELLAENEIMRKEISNLYSSVNEMGKENDQISRSINRMIGDLDMEDDDMISQSAARAVRTSNDGGELIETSLSMQILGKMKVSFQLLQSDRADMQIDIKEKTAAISDLEVRVQQISARNKVLSTECISLTTELHDSKKEASLEQDILSSKIALLEANLLQSTQEVERLNSEIKLLESNHAETRACLERDKNGLIELTKDMTQQIANLVERIGYANAELNDSKKTSSLEIEQLNDTILTQAACLLESQQYGDSLLRDLDAVRKSLDDTTMKKNLLLAENETMQKSLNSSEFEAGWLEEQLSSKILSLEEELCKAKQEEERLGGVVESLEHSYAKERAHLEDGKIDLESRLDTLRGTSAAEQKQQSFKIASLEAELLQTLNEEERLVEVVKSLERSHAEELARFKEVNIDLECRMHTLKETSMAEQEQQSSKIASLETDLVQALKEEERLGGVVKSLERSHAEELARFEEVKIDLECRMHTMAETSASKQEQLRSAIVSLEADLLQVLQELDYAEEEKNGNQHRTHTLTETSAAENLQGNVLALKLTAKSLAEKAKKRSEEIQSLIQQVGDTEIRFNVNEAENRSLTIKISSLMMKNNDQYDQIVELTTCLDDETSENANLKKSLADEKLDNEVLGNRFAGLENERVAAMTKIEELSAELKSTAITLSDVQQLIIADQKQLLQMQDTIRSLEVEKQRDHDALQSITRDRDDNIRKLEFSRQEADDFKCKLESSESLAESITNQCEKVQSLLQASGNEVNYLKKKLEYSERMTKKLENECDNLNRSIIELNTKRNEENQRNILRCRQQHETSQCEIACLENIIASLKKELDAFKSEARTATAAQLKSCEAKLESLCANDEDGTLQRRDRTFDGLILALGKELSRLRGESTSTAKKLAEAQREFSSLESIVTLLKKEHEALRIEARAAVEAQIRSCEAKLAPLCSNGGQGALSKQCRSFDNMIAIIQEELSSLSIMAKNLDEAQNESAILEQQVRILSSEVSKYKLQNRGMLQALDELTIGMGDSDAYS
jgi:chromosome segregation ATPase